MTSPALSLIWNHTTGHAPDDRRFKDEQLEGLPHFVQMAVAKECKNRNPVEGNRYLLETSSILKGPCKKVGSDEDELRTTAKAKARKITLATIKHPEPLQMAMDLTEAEGIPAPDGRTMTTTGKLARMKDGDHWWRRQLRKYPAREFELAMIRAGLVHRGRAKYISDESFDRRHQQKVRNYRVLETMQAINELGHSFTLAELAEKSTSNPALRRNELMTRMSGLESIARNHNMAGEFVTMTTPSRFHPMSTTGGKLHKNPNYDGSSPREAADYLQKVWARIRAKLTREGIQRFGFRIAEPHHDATPHWHMLLFMEPSQVEQFRAIVSRYALAESPNEPGANKYRVDFKAIDYRKGTATGYVAKYVSKNIDGAHLQTDAFGPDPAHTAARVEAWAATWGIRQFQQIGSASVTVYRELRRVDESPLVMEPARKAADNGDFAAYVMAQGGPTVTPRTQKLHLAKRPALDTDNGEINLNRYNEPAAPATVGVYAGPLFLLTRLHSWAIERKVDNENITQGAGSNGSANQRNGTGRADGTGAQIGRRGLYGDASQNKRPIAGISKDVSCSANGKLSSFSGRMQPTQAGGIGCSQECPSGTENRLGFGLPWSPVNNCTRGAPDSDPFGAPEHPPPNKKLRYYS